jgi:hypothetical protein
MRFGHSFPTMFTRNRPAPPRPRRSMHMITLATAFGMKDKPMSCFVRPWDGGHYEHLFNSAKLTERRWSLRSTLQQANEQHDVRKTFSLYALQTS